ncbi:Peptide deformylase [Posidoniimonas corsicana]|uniref:Peptide deformylase n=1 Tax=Posidoniimonas corsicana TaxID=1938618 RepID=A0A5C5UX95_9BACT|nr:peptide deformylase [Posidoniimonas corsicana]TWT30961.1 Peptide deformylase [Posidoniimonas corsicana]
MPLSIIHYPHPTLRHTSRPLKRVDADLKRMVAEMFELMYEHEGVGLAANQVDLPYRLFVMNQEGDADAREHERVFINPVLSKGKGSEEGQEGCLSVPGVYAQVPRKTSVIVEAYDLSGNEIKEEARGMTARILQHETDHLDGVMFFDRIGPTAQAAIEPQIEEFFIDFQSRRAVGEAPTDEQVAARLDELEKLRT